MYLENPLIWEKYALAPKLDYRLGQLTINVKHEPSFEVINQFLKSAWKVRAGFTAKRENIKG